MQFSHGEDGLGNVRNSDGERGHLKYLIDLMLERGFVQNVRKSDSRAKAEGVVVEIGGGKTGREASRGKSG